MATQYLTVKYNNVELTPTPIVNYSLQPVDFGYVYGYNTNISLQGIFTGISTYTAAVSYITGVFYNQFKDLKVQDDLGNTLYSWSGVTVDTISFDSNPYLRDSLVRYNVKLRAYDFPSGVIEPSNEYSFTQNEDSTVSVSHKISARGVRNSAGAFENAVAFVKMFTGKDPFANCAPIMVPTGSGVLISINENINRAEGIYAVTESYRYNSGASTPYVKTTSLDVSEMIDSEFRVIDYNVKFQGSPIIKNAGQIIASLNYNLLADIQNEFGFSTTNWVKNNYSADIDSGSSTVNVKVGYVSGANLSGFFDYEVSCEQDELAGTETWKVGGQFRCFGPLDFKRQQLALFRNVAANGKEEWTPYLSGLIINSPLYNNFHRLGKTFSQNMKIDIVENPLLAQLSISASASDGYEPEGISELKSSWEVSPSRWIYELLPSVNLEGCYVVQDLQTKTKTRQKMSLSAKSYNISSGKSSLEKYMTGWAGKNIVSGTYNAVTAFLEQESYNTGTYDVSMTNAWVGLDNGLSSGILALKSVGNSRNSIPIRPAGFNFGY